MNVREVEGQERPQAHAAELAQDVHGSLQAGAGFFDERLRPGGVSDRFPLTPSRWLRGESLAFWASRSSLDEMVAGDAVGRTPADARSGVLLVADAPPRGRRRSTLAGDAARSSGQQRWTPAPARSPSHLIGVARRHQIANTMLLLSLVWFGGQGYSPLSRLMGLVFSQTVGEVAALISDARAPTSGTRARLGHAAVSRSLPGSLPRDRGRMRKSARTGSTAYVGQVNAL